MTAGAAAAVKEEEGDDYLDRGRKSGSQGKGGWGAEGLGVDRG
jgi:hypothetical protein